MTTCLNQTRMTSRITTFRKSEGRLGYLGKSIVISFFWFVCEEHRCVIWYTWREILFDRKVLFFFFFSFKILRRDEKSEGKPIRAQSSRHLWTYFKVCPCLNHRTIILSKFSMMNSNRPDIPDIFSCARVRKGLRIFYFFVQPWDEQGCHIDYK